MTGAREDTCGDSWRLARGDGESFWECSRELETGVTPATCGDIFETDCSLVRPPDFVEGVRL